jgi:hypothetical protein
VYVLKNRLAERRTAVSESVAAGTPASFHLGASYPNPFNPRAGVRRMMAEEFEDYVQAVVSHLEICRNGRILRNVRYAGKRQPGMYEIDIAAEFSAGGTLFFLVIVECKNWDRPVDRPVIQKLIQTRDAICAQKGVVVSPVGF